LEQAMSGVAGFSSEKIAERVIEKVEGFVLEAERSDDITLLVIQRRN
jgi:serine phosphatase RsbU (regulator of sigma subunit)